MPHWVWNMEWERQPDPIPGQFQEVACFERPTSSQHKRHNADIVCGIEFSPDGWFLASAGVTKQARLLSIPCANSDMEFRKETEVLMETRAWRGLPSFLYWVLPVNIHGCEQCCNIFRCRFETGANQTCSCYISSCQAHTAAAAALPAYQCAPSLLSKVVQLCCVHADLSHCCRYGYIRWRMSEQGRLMMSLCVLSSFTACRLRSAPSPGILLRR